MKKILAACAITLFLMSCQQEINFDTPTDPGGGGGGGSTSGKLVKVVTVTNGETQTTLYTYDSQDRIETLTVDGTSGGMLMHSYSKYFRDGLGRMVMIKQKIDQNGIPTDTAVNHIHYPDATTMEFDYHVNTMSMMGFTTVDSSVYNFSNGKLQYVTSYMSSSIMGTTWEASRNEFIYDGSGRVIELKMFMSGTPGDPLENLMNQHYTYATSLNAVPIPQNPAQAYWFGLPNATNDALATMDFESFDANVPSFTTNMTYVLGANNKPATATFTSTNGQVTNYTFYYQ